MDHSNRRFPLVDVTRDQLTAVLSPLLNGRGIESIQHVEEGLTNTILRVSVAGSTPDLLVRIYAGRRALWDKERRLLTRLPSSLLAPTVLLADEGRGALPYPSLVYEWIGGINLNAMRRVASSEELLSLAAPLGRILASISKIEADERDSSVRGRQPPPSSPEALLTLTQHRLLRGRARARLGEGTADALWKYVLSESGRLCALGSARCLARPRRPRQQKHFGGHGRRGALANCWDCRLGGCLHRVGDVGRRQPFPVPTEVQPSFPRPVRARLQDQRWDAGSEWWSLQDFFDVNAASGLAGRRRGNACCAQSALVSAAPTTATSTKPRSHKKSINTSTKEGSVVSGEAAV